MKNKYFNRSARNNQNKYCGQSEYFESCISPQPFPWQQQPKFISFNVADLKLSESAILKGSKNPESKDQNYTKRSSFSPKRSNKSFSSPRVLNPKVIDIEWSHQNLKKKSKRSNSIHSFNGNSFMSLDRRLESDKIILEYQRSIAMSLSPSQSSSYKQSKKIPNFLTSKMNPSRSKHYNRMFQLCPADKNKELYIKGMFSYPVKENFNLIRSHLQP